MSVKGKGRAVAAVTVLFLVLLSGCGRAGAGFDMSDIAGGAVSETEAWGRTTLTAETEGVQVTPTRRRESFFDEKTREMRGSYEYLLPRMSAVRDTALAASASAAFNEGMARLFEEKSAEWRANFEESDDTLLSDEAWCNEITYGISRTGDLLSILFTEYMFTGGAHGFTVYDAYFFSLTDLKFITTDALTDDMDALTYAVAEEILRQIDDTVSDEEMVYWENYHDIIREWTSHNCSIGFTADGKMILVFPAYEIASYAAGAQFFTVDADVYKPYLNEYGRRLLEP